MRTRECRSGFFGSIHSSHLPENVESYCFYVPDFFDDNVFAHPSYLKPFQQFNLGMTRRSARNVDAKIPADLLLQFARSAPRLGLSPDTLLALGKQILSERAEPRRKIRRRSLQSLLMGDVFIDQVRKHRPEFSTFYTNHVAAAMHRYWAATYPEDEEHRAMSDDWIRDYQDEIFAAMGIFDTILAKTKRYCDETGTQLIIATSMGQGAVPHQETRQFVTLTNTEKFMAVLGFEPGQFRKRHAMVPCGGVVVPLELVPKLSQMLDQVSIDGKPFVKSDNEITPLSYGIHDEGFVSLFSYFESYAGEDRVMIGNRSLSFEEAGFGYTAHEDGVSVTAHHVPDGALIIYNPRTPISKASREVVSTTEVAPAILQHFGLPVPDYMGQRTGKVAEALAQA